MTSSGIEPATFRSVAQHLNHCATAVPCCRGKTLSMIYFVFVALFIQHTVSMRHIAFSSVTSLSLSQFSTFSNKWHDFIVNFVETEITQLVIAVRNFANAPKIVSKCNRPT